MGAPSILDAARWLERPCPHLGQFPDRRGSDDLAFVGEGLVVLFNVIEIVKVVHHDSIGLLKARGGQIAERIDPFEPRAIAEMKPRDRIDDAAIGATGVDEIIGGKRRQHTIQSVDGGGLGRPVWMFEKTQRASALGREKARVFLLALSIEPLRKAGNRRKRDEALQARQLPLQLLDDLLDEEIAEADAGEALLRI